MIHALDHAVILVRDLDRAAETYRKLLGRPPSWRGHHPQLGTANALYALDNTYLELLSPQTDGGLADALRDRLAQSGEGPLALAFATDDADKCATTLSERGLPAPAPAPGEGGSSDGGAIRRWRNVHLDPAHTRGVALFAIEHDPESPGLEQAATDASADACIHAIDHVVVLTAAPDDGLRLYGEQLGLRLALDKRFDERGVRLVFFRVGGLTVELAASLNDPDPPDHDLFWGISFRVADVAAARERLDELGFDVSPVRSGHKPGTRVCTVRSETHGVATLLLGPE